MLVSVALWQWHEGKDQSTKIGSSTDQPSLFTTLHCHTIRKIVRYARVATDSDVRK